jgi:hypothetical protein
MYQIRNFIFLYAIRLIIVLDRMNQSVFDSNYVVFVSCRSCRNLDGILPLYGLSDRVEVYLINALVFAATEN